jgi:hypothetical protein
MHPDRPGLFKTTKAQALNVLTDGVPTLAVSYDGRRQIFVESPTDARLYNDIHQHLKPILASERSLEFVATGTHTNTGRDIVRHLVNELANAGNTSVFGLIDWDGKNEPSPRISVLAHGRRDGLENIILDPLLVAALIVRDARKHASQIGLGDQDSWPQVMTFSPEKLQPIVDRLQSIVVGPSGTLVECRYVGNFSLKLNDAYLRIDDHRLEDRILEQLPALNQFSKGRSGALMQHIVDTVMRDQPHYIPMELYDAFRKLLEQPSHAC